jgi:hypothetical protein
MTDYKDALENLLKFVFDQAKNHPDAEQRELATKVSGDFVFAALMSIATKGAAKAPTGDRTNVVDLPTGREPGA